MSEIAGPQDQAAARDVSHETTDADFRGVFLFGAALAVMLVLVLCLALWLFHFLDARESSVKHEETPLVEEHGQLPRGVLLEGLPGSPGQGESAGQEISEQQDYQWVDPQQRIIRMPIQAAMSALADRLPAGKPAAARQKDAERRVQPTAANAGRSSHKGQP